MVLDFLATCIHEVIHQLSVVFVDGGTVNEICMSHVIRKAGMSTTHVFMWIIPYIIMGLGQMVSRFKIEMS